jgi:hypothetical protein
MCKKLTWVAAVIGVSLLGSGALAQEIKVHTGFIFYAGKYSMDESTYGLYEEGHKLEGLLKENPSALSAFRGFEGWHTTANVMTGLALGSIVLGGVFYMPGVKDEVPGYTGIVCFGVGGGLLVFGLVSEFISWSRLSKAEEVFNRSIEVDDGPALNLIPMPSFAFLPRGGQLGLTWQF